MKPAIGVTILLMSLAANITAQNTSTGSTQPMGSGKAIPIPQTGGTPCLFDFERGEVPDCVRESAKGSFFIAPEYVKELRFEAQGLAAVRSPSKGWMYVNRGGNVLITGVPVMDNSADSFHEGLVRIVRNSKYGFANRSGQIVIPPVYDGAMNFEKGGATVCKGCKSKCVDPACEVHAFAGGEWFRINTKGVVIARLHPDN